MTQSYLGRGGTQHEGGIRGKVENKRNEVSEENEEKSSENERTAARSSVSLPSEKETEEPTLLPLLIS